MEKLENQFVEFENGKQRLKNQLPIKYNEYKKQLALKKRILLAKVKEMDMNAELLTATPPAFPRPKSRTGSISSKKFYLKSVSVTKIGQTPEVRNPKLKISLKNL